MTSHLHPASLRTLPVVGTRRVRPHWGLGEGSGFPMRLLQLIPDLPGAEGELLCQALDICFPILNQRGLSSELKELMAVETEFGSGPDIHCPLPAGRAVRAPYRPSAPGCTCACCVRCLKQSPPPINSNFWFRCAASGPRRGLLVDPQRSELPSTCLLCCVQLASWCPKIWADPDLCIFSTHPVPGYQ